MLLAFFFYFAALANVGNKFLISRHHWFIHKWKPNEKRIFMQQATEIFLHDSKDPDLKRMKSVSKTSEEGQNYKIQ